MSWKKGEKIINEALGVLIFENDEFKHIEDYLSRVEKALLLLKEKEGGLK